MTRRYIPLVLLTIGVFLACNDKTTNTATHAWDLVPADNMVTGYTAKTGALEMISEVDTVTYDNLWDVRNGGAEVYTDRGFIEGTHNTYTNGTDEIEIKIYNQGVADSALSVYNHVGSYCSETIDTIGVTSCLEAALVVQTIRAVKGKYYIEVIVPNSTGAKETGILFVKAIAARLG